MPDTSASVRQVDPPSYVVMSISLYEKEVEILDRIAKKFSMSRSGAIRFVINTFDQQEVEVKNQ